MKRAALAWAWVASFAACGYDDGRTGRDGGDLVDAPGSAPDGARSDAPAGPACANHLDDDCDGLVDLVDPGCASASDPDERGFGTACDDGLDNDNDGRIDFVAAGCGTIAGDPGCDSPGDVTELDVGPP